MYEERSNFSIRNLLLQILLVVLFVFIMIWLFPTKSYMDDNYVTKDELFQQLQSIYGRNFADNVESMRDAAKNYFTNERLPKELGDSVTLTLGEMLDKKLVMEFIDSNGNKCDTKDSYVKITKMDNEYQMKVQLTCSDYSDYIIDYMGCYDYCDSCNNTIVVKPSNNKPSNNKPNNTNPDPVVSKKYNYQYRLTTQNTYSDWTEWSNWSTSKVSANLLTQVEVDKRQELDGYTKNYEITGYKTETYTDYENQTYTEYIKETYTTYETQTYTDYETQTETVASGTKKVLVSSENPTYKGYYTSWTTSSPVTTVDKILYSTDTIQYTLESTDRYLDCNDRCKYVTERHYTVKTRKWVNGDPICPAGYTFEGTKCNKYDTQTTYEEKTTTVPVTKTKQVAVTKTRQVPVTKTRQVPVTKIKQVAVTKTRQVPVYGYVNGDPIYKTVTYYRFRTRTQLTYASVDYKWSESNNDATLLSQGYELTGYYEEV